MSAQASKSKGAEPHAPIYAIVGREDFLKRTALAELTDRVLADADRSLALAEFEGTNSALTLADVLDEVRTLPFLTDRRLVILRDADPFITRYRSELEDYVDQPATTGVLVLECKSLPGNTRLAKRIAAIGQVVKCDPVNARTAPGWLKDRCRAGYGKQLDSHAAAVLCDQIGTELGLLDAELQKLAVYVGERPKITASDVEALGGRCREEQVWGILSAVAAGHPAEAIAIWEDVWQTDRAASARAIAGIAFTVRRLLAAKRAQEAGAGVDELRKVMMIWRDDQRLQRELGAFTIGQIEKMLCLLLEADVAAKTGQATVRSSVEAFIIEMCQQRRSGRSGGQRATG